MRPLVAAHAGKSLTLSELRTDFSGEERVWIEDAQGHALAFQRETGLAMGAPGIVEALAGATHAARATRAWDRHDRAETAIGRPRESALSLFASVLAAPPWHLPDRAVVRVAAALGWTSFRVLPRDIDALRAAEGRIRKLRARLSRVRCPPLEDVDTLSSENDDDAGAR